LFLPLLLGQALLFLGLLTLLALGQMDLLLTLLLLLLTRAGLGGDRVAVDLLLLDRRRLGDEVLGHLLARRRGLFGHRLGQRLRQRLGFLFHGLRRRRFGLWLRLRQRLWVARQR